MRIDDISKLGPAAQRQILEKLGAASSPKAKKYHNKETKVATQDGVVHKFASQKEADRYRELMVMLRAGQIRDLKLQPQFTLQESYVTPEGERIRAIKYVADFSYKKPVKIADETVWATVVEDTKSDPTQTQKYKIKKKLMMEKYGIKIQEI